MDLQALYDQAVAAHRAGQLADAERGYLRILAVEPRNAHACYPLGVLRAQQGRLDEALELIGAALAEYPDAPEMLLNHANVLMGLGRFVEALADYDRVVALRPRDAVTHNSRGNTLLKLGRYDEALAAFDRAIGLQPDYFIAHNNRGNVLKRLRRYDEAAAAFARTLALKPDFAPALYNRGKALCQEHRIAEGFADFLQSARMTNGVPVWAAENPAPHPHKARHDGEQRAWLRQTGSRGTIETLHIEGGGRLDGPAINPVNVADATAQWRTRQPQVVVIDNLLTPDALAELRRFCWGSTVWRTDYKDGYLGAFPEHGFAVPLLAQVAEEFRTTYPGICGDHALNYIWAFKYDSALDGIGVHADRAAVNVNFWITPDEANLDPEHGGLVVWDKAAPLDWDFDRYNGDIAATRAFLQGSEAQPMTVPYRANRAVIFDSDLFHETDVIRFREGYRNRRINVTLLYGERA